MIRSLIVRVTGPEPQRAVTNLGRTSTKRDSARGLPGLLRLAPIAWAVASILTGCTSEHDQAIGTTSEALNGVMGCQMTAEQCHFAAKSLDDGRTCDLQLRACLSGLVPDGGASQPTAAWPLDAGAKSPRLSFAEPKVWCDDAGLTPPSLFDAGFATPPELLELDAGPAPTDPDASLPLPPSLPTGTPSTATADAGFHGGHRFEDGGLMSIVDCLETLGHCLEAETAPMDCADQAFTCLKSAISTDAPRL